MRILGNVTIGTGATLTVSPGTKLTFTSAAPLIINGTMNAVGTSAQPITFDFVTPYSNNGLKFYQNASGTLSHCNISHATYGVYAENTGGLYAQHAEPSITYCNISGNTYGLYYNNAGTFSNTVQNNTISGNFSHGVYLYKSWPQTFLDNTITGNWADGISLNNSNGNIASNTITGNGGYAIYCYNYSAPVITYNLIGPNNSYGVVADYYSPANLGSAFTGDGRNRFHEATASIAASYHSDVIAGDYYGYGHNSFYADQLVCWYLIIDNSIMEASYNYWEYLNYPDAYITNGGRLDYTTVLYDDPNPRMGGMVNIYSSAPISPLKKAGFKTGASDTSTFLDADLKNSLNALLSGNYAQAIQQYSRRYATETDPIRKQYVLTRLGECYRNAKRKDFPNFLNSSVRPNLSKNDLLYATTLQLENIFFTNDGKYEQAVANFKMLADNFAEDTNTVKHFLFGLWSLYQFELNDTIKAQEYLDELKAQYPSDNLTWHARLLKGEIKGNPNSKQNQKDARTAISVLPIRTELFTNYPNPFNPTTVIKYQLAANSQVALKVYDILGREVATLVDGLKEAGSYSATFDGTRLASGIYIIRLSATPEDGSKPFTQVKKMVLLR
jgi:parallel beta-helix repeat protein